MIPTPEFFQHYYQYVIWADLRQLAAVKELNEAELTIDRGFSFGTILRVLAHELSAQSVWLDRFTDVAPVWLMDSPLLGTLPSLESQWAEVHLRGGNFMKSLTPDRLQQTLHYKSLKGQAFAMPLWRAVFQLCQHALHHRGQLNSMITLAGGKAPVVDYSAYALEAGKTPI